MSQLEKHRKTSKTRFNIPGSSKVFIKFYQYVVSLRHKQFINHESLAVSLEKVAKWIENGNGTCGLLLAGNPGNGKTTVINTLVELIRCSKLPDPSQLDYYGNPIYAKLSTFVATDLTRIYQSDPEQFNNIKKSSLLAIDDLGTEPVEIMSYGNYYSPIIELLYFRYEKQLLTIISTNLTPKNITERYGERLSDRLSEMMTIVSFPDFSFRRSICKIT